MIIGVLVLAFGQTLDQPAAVETAANLSMTLNQMGA
jgi:hypothetical protein